MKWFHEQNTPTSYCVDPKTDLTHKQPAEAYTNAWMQYLDEKLLPEGGKLPQSESWIEGIPNVFEA